jgi:hypothetical protein
MWVFIKNPPLSWNQKNWRRRKHGLAPFGHNFLLIILNRNC